MEVYLLNEIQNVNVKANLSTGKIVQDQLN